MEVGVACAEALFRCGEALFEPGLLVGLGVRAGEGLHEAACSAAMRADASVRAELLAKTQRVLSKRESKGGQTGRRGTRKRS